MPRPHREIPSQRLAVARARPVTPAAKPQRSLWWTVGITLAGWVLLAYPLVLLAALSLVVMTGSLEAMATPSDVAAGVAGMAAALAMLAFPLLLGLAVKVRRRSLWIPALLTGVISVAALIYITVEWLIPLG